jgi:dipeptidyl-peptidase-4
VRYDSATAPPRRADHRGPAHSPGSTSPIEIEDLSWSHDAQRVLIFTNTRRVWRTNSRGDYWLLDRRSGQLKKIGGDAPEGSVDVCEVQSRRHEGRLRAAERHLRRDIATGARHG